MIALDLLPVPSEPCACCGGALAAQGWLIPGMRSLARTRCTSCDRAGYADLPAGQALSSPMTLDADSGQVGDRHGVAWFADWLRDGYADRTAAMPAFTVERRHPVTRSVVLLNCLDVLYGHCLLKLLSAQRHLDGGRHDVIVMIQPFLRDLVPDDVAECWVVGLPLRDGIRWSDGLAARIAEEVARVGTVMLAPVPSHPHPSSFDIERFSRVRPFAVARWNEVPPCVTFIWRDDRQWTLTVPPARGWRRTPPTDQGSTVTAFLEELRRHLPSVDAAVAGVGRPSALPGWITDLRATAPDPDVDRQWLQRYAASHLVVGVHGSNMLLPSAHAGGAIEMIGAERAGNFLQDMVFNGDDARDLFFRYRFVAPDISPVNLAALAAQIVARYPDFDRLMGRHDAGDA